MKLKNKTVIKNIPTLKCLLELMKKNCSEKEYNSWYNARINMQKELSTMINLLSSDTSKEYIYFENKDSSWSSHCINTEFIYSDKWRLIDYSDIIRTTQTLDIE